MRAACCCTVQLVHPFILCEGIATTNQVLTATIQSTSKTIDCSFMNNQSFYCVVCCSTDPSVPPDSSVYNVSSTRGTVVTVYLDGLSSGQMYYCKAAATNTTSANCSDPVVGGVKVYFIFMINNPESGNCIHSQSLWNCNYQPNDMIIICGKASHLHVCKQHTSKIIISLINFNVACCSVLQHKI